MSVVSNEQERRRHQLISEVSLREFGVAPKSILRMRGGICNEVYQILLGRRELIVRMNAAERFLLGSHNHIPLFKAKGIRVPDILAEDYSKQFIPYAYQILIKMEGRDIGDVIDTLSDEQLRAIAGEVSRIFRLLRDVRTNGQFGVLWASSTSNTPLVSMMLTTRDRPRFLQVAFACYQHQTYPLRELIVIDDGDQFPVDELSVEAVGGRLIHMPAGTPLGTKLNRGIEEAQGWVCQKMDDDDWYGPPLP
jgi:Phosphotransferase enzyme family/Glycosyl transferase family 2